MTKSLKESNPLTKEFKFNVGIPLDALGPNLPASNHAERMNKVHQARSANASARKAAQQRRICRVCKSEGVSPCQSKAVTCEPWCPGINKHIVRIEELEICYSCANETFKRSTSNRRG
jgi:hypothetical protein